MVYGQGRSDRTITNNSCYCCKCKTSFSNLKIIKNVQRFTMSNERLFALGIISLGYEVARPLYFDVLVDKFA